MLRDQTRAILWAQWRSFVNRSPLLRRSFPLTGIVLTIWYGLWTFAAVAVGIACGDPEALPVLREALPGALLLATLYWQLIPILMATSGASLDMRRLIVYPIARSQLFLIEVALRVTSAVEMLLLATGASAGMLLNPRLPAWGVFGMLAFVLFNLFLASALRDLLTRLMGRKHARELVILGIVLISALPQVLVHSRAPHELAGQARYLMSVPWPWVAAGQFAAGVSPFVSGLALLGWLAAAYALARQQFNKTLRENPAEMRAKERAASRGGIAEALYLIPPRLFRDPLGALVEKEVRSLSRSPRFRLVFIMGFTFGLLVWFPIAFRGDGPNWVGEHFLTVAFSYQVLLLGEVVIWNVFGFDRRAAQTYFVVPVRLSTVLIAKNLSAAFFVLLDAVLILVMSALLRFPITPAMLLEAFTVLPVFGLLLISAGNMLSMRNARPIDPDRSWGGTAARGQAMLLLVYPLVMAPVALAFLARHAFETEWAFYGVMALVFVIACVVYWIALESALQAAYERRELILAALSRESGVLAV